MGSKKMGSKKMGSKKMGSKKWRGNPTSSGAAIADDEAPGAAHGTGETTVATRRSSRLYDREPVLVVRQRGGIVDLVSGNVVLLSSAALETERRFGRLTSRFLPACADRTARVLVGGLGFGATARGVLDAVPGPVDVLIVEKVAAIERLVRADLAHFADHVLGDPRVRVLVADVGDVLAGSVATFDAILLDVDNGPHWASFRTNARLYTPAGLEAARRALAPGGFVAVWSGYPAPAFAAALRAAGLEPTTVPLVERGRVRARAYVGKLPGTAACP